jgi:hypothetical protein
LFESVRGRPREGVREREVGEIVRVRLTIRRERNIW